MNIAFAKKIAFQCNYKKETNASIAANLGINKNTVARIRKIYKDLKYTGTLRTATMQRLSEKHQVSQAMIAAIHKEIRHW